MATEGACEIGWVDVTGRGDLAEHEVVSEPRAVPPSCAAGFLLGGGVGFNVRTFGVGIDALVGSQIVLADGDILTLSDTQNSDLFWACPGGGGGNFGINTSFSLQTYPVPPS